MPPRGKHPQAGLGACQCACHPALYESLPLGQYSRRLGLCLLHHRVLSPWFSVWCILGTEIFVDWIINGILLLGIQILGYPVMEGSMI